MDFAQATELQSLILEQRERGEISREIVTSLDQDDLARMGGLGELWRVIVEWPDHLKVVIRDAEQWDVRKEWFQAK